MLIFILPLSVQVPLPTPLPVVTWCILTAGRNILMIPLKQRREDIGEDLRNCSFQGGWQFAVWKPPFFCINKKSAILTHWVRILRNFVKKKIHNPFKNWGLYILPNGMRYFSLCQYFDYLWSIWKEKNKIRNPIFRRFITTLDVFFFKLQVTFNCETQSIL